MIKVAILSRNAELSSALSSLFTSSEKYTVNIVCDNAADGVERLRKEQVDLLVLDYLLPHGGGQAVLRALQEQAARPMCIALGNDTDDCVVNEILSSGVNRYLLKPVSAQEVFWVIEEMFLRRGAEQMPSSSSHESVLSHGVAIASDDSARFEQNAIIVQNVNNSQEETEVSIPSSLSDEKSTSEATASSGDEGEETEKEAVGKTGRTLDGEITHIFITIGISPNLIGYWYLREGIKLAVHEPKMINEVTKRLYPEIGKKFETTASRVERAIRHAIEVGWNRGRIDAINAIFGARVYVGNERPTNSEFIALVADKLLLDGFH